MSEEEKVENEATSEEGKSEYEGYTTPDDGTPKEEAPVEKEDTGTSEDKAGEEPPKEPEKEEVKTTEDTSGDAKEEEVPRGVRKRIDKVVAARHKAQEEAAYWRGRAEKAEAGEAPEGTGDTSADNESPVASDYETEEEFITALTDHKVAQALKEYDAKVTERTANEKKEAAERERKDTFAKQIDTARDKHVDYDEVVFEQDTLPITQDMYEAIQASPDGAEIAYRLGKDPDECARIANLTPQQAAREIWGMETKPSADTPSTPPIKTNNVSKAPEPIVPSVGGAGGGEIDDDSMSIADWMKRENARDAKRRSQGG